MPAGLSRLPLHLLLGFAVFMSLLFGLQDWLIYHPHRYDPSQLAAFAEPSGLRPWPSPDGYRGFTSLHPPKEVRGTVLVFHGNAGSAVQRVYYRDYLPDRFRLVLIEYPGYGAREGRPGEAEFLQEGVESMQRVREQFGRPIYLLGESLGAAVATGVAAYAGIAIDGLILCTPWDDLPSLAQSIYWFLPVKPLVRDRYDNVAALRSYRGPLAVIVAKADEIVPVRFGLHTYESYAGRKRLWTVAGSHNTWLARTNPGWWEGVFRFLQPSAPQRLPPDAGN